MINLLLGTFLLARVTVADQLQAQQNDYQAILSRYSAQHQQQLKDFSAQVAQFNKDYTDQLDQQMITTGEILDEYQRRHDDPKRNQKQLTYFTPRDELATNDPIEEARYWVTYAHEAIAYQAAHHYILSLHGESAMRSDASSLINNMRADLNGLNQKVIKAEKMVLEVVKKP